eukprot:6987656-Prymnesium_polylepis.1
MAKMCDGIAPRAARGARLRRPRDPGPARHAARMGMHRPAQRARAATRRYTVSYKLSPWRYKDFAQSKPR